MGTGDELVGALRFRVALVLVDLGLDAILIGHFAMSHTFGTCMFNGQS